MHLVRVYTNDSMTRFSIIFCGTSPFAVPSLEALIGDDAFDILAVITQPDRPTGRKQVLTPPAIKMTAQQHNLKLIQTENINDLFLSPTSYFLSPPDFLVVVSFGQILKDNVLTYPTIMPINLHASLLPRWRGASPIQQAILAGDKETGVTVQTMVKQLDAGPVLSQSVTPIDPRETAITLHDRLAQMGAKLLCDTLKSPLNSVEQDESEITVCRKLTREDGIADPETSTAEEFDRKVRALTPWPAVTVTINGEQLKIIESALTPTGDSHPLPCNGNSMLYLVTVQPANGKPMTGAAWGRGRA